MNIYILKKIIAVAYLVLVLSILIIPIHFILADTVCQPPKVISPDGNSCVTPPSTPPTNYQLLAPLPNPSNPNEPLTTFDSTGAGGGALGGYLNLMIRLFIGICAVLAVIMIVIGGIQYMTTELISSKEEGKKRIMGAIFGLLLALGAYTLLNTINPDLLNTDLKSLKGVTVEVNVEDFIVTDASGRVVGPINPRSVGTLCDQREVAAAAQAAGQNLTSAQIGVISCIGGIESGCQSVKNYNWGSGSSAYGPFQILLQGNAGCFESSVCRQVAGVSGPLNCAAGFRGGNPIPGSPIVEQCKKAANNFTCSVSAATCLIKNRPDYGDWNANAKLPWCKSQFNH